MTAVFTRTLNLLESTFLYLGGIHLLFLQFIRELVLGRMYWRLLFDQIYLIGVKSFPLIMITAGSTGMVMSLQFGLGLEKFGGTLYVPKLVAATILREMGPVFTSLMLAARVGAGITSEVGSMVVTQQVDAIRALGSSPIKRIVVPRVLATLITLPILVSMANIIGNLGGLLIGAYELNLDPSYYYLKVLTTSRLSDYLSGFGKTFFFAFIISLTACYFGFNVRNGTKEVGISTTRSVVVSSIFILIADFFLSKLFWIIEKA